MSEERATVTWEELSWSTSLSQEALMRVLIRKGIVTSEEVLQEVKTVQAEYAGKKS